MTAFDPILFYGSSQLGIHSAEQGTLISASTDIQAVSTWLAEFADENQYSSHTRSLYRKEVERFMLWLNYRQLALADIKREDVQDFRLFLAKPPASWCGPKRARSHPEWKPFVGPLAAGTQQTANAVITNMMAYLANAGYLKGNPFSLKKMKAPPRDMSLGADRFLAKDELSLLFASIEAMPVHTLLDRDHAARCRWIAVLLYASAARRGDVTAGTMSDFHAYQNRWWWHVEGKGGVVADIPVADLLLVELVKFRRHLGLSDLPVAGEETPVVPSVRRKQGKHSIHPLSDNGLHKIIKQMGANAARFAEQHGHSEMADKFKRLSAHWFRHTHATHSLQHYDIPLYATSANMRHASLATTSIYSHDQILERHRLTQGFGQGILDKKLQD